MKVEFDTHWGGTVEILKPVGRRSLVANLSVWRWEKSASQVLASQVLESTTFDGAIDEAQTLWGWEKDRKKL